LDEAEEEHCEAWRFASDDAGISGVMPEGWTRGGPDEAILVVRSAYDGDPTMLYQQGFAGLPMDALKEELMAHVGRQGEPFPERRHKSTVTTS
jgi:hypothetical protein